MAWICFIATALPTCREPTTHWNKPWAVCGTTNGVPQARKVASPSLALNGCIRMASDIFTRARTVTKDMLAAVPHAHWRDARTQLERRRRARCLRYRFRKNPAAYLAGLETAEDKLNVPSQKKNLRRFPGGGSNTLRRQQLRICSSCPRSRYGRTSHIPTAGRGRRYRFRRRRCAGCSLAVPAPHPSSHRY